MSIDVMRILIARDCVARCPSDLLINMLQEQSRMQSISQSPLFVFCGNALNWKLETEEEILESVLCLTMKWSLIIF